MGNNRLCLKSTTPKFFPGGNDRTPTQNCCAEETFILFLFQKSDAYKK